jgi:hypothetical protein
VNMSYLLNYTFGQNNQKEVSTSFDLFKFNSNILILGFINNEKAYKITLNADLTLKHFEYYLDIAPFGNYTHHQKFSQKHIDLLNQESMLNFSILTEIIQKEFFLNQVPYIVSNSLNHYFNFKNENGVMHHDFVYHGRKNMDMCKASLIKKDDVAYLIISSNKLDTRYLKFKLQYKNEQIHVIQTEIYDNIFLSDSLQDILVSFSYVLQRPFPQEKTIEAMPTFNDLLMSYFCIDSFD